MMQTIEKAQSYKYRFRELMSDLPWQEYLDKMNELEAAMRIKRDMLNKYKRATVHDTRAMTTDQLVAAAKVLGIEPMDLLNLDYHAAQAA